MRRPIVVLTFVVGVVAVGLGVASVGCGGNDKPPLTPDTSEPSPDGIDAGPAPATPGSLPPAK